MTWAWQNLADWWTLAHCWGWAAACFAALRVWPGWVLWCPPRFSVRILPVAQIVFWLAVAVGVAWEFAEWLWVEPWLSFREPIGNRLFDVAVDSFGAWFGCRLGRRREEPVISTDAIRARSDGDRW